MNNDIDIKNLKQYKRLGYGTEGIIILTTDDKYTVKIYKSSQIYIKSYIWIVKYLQKYNLPTIYKSYKLLSKKNSLERYKKEMPEYFSYLDEENMKSRLIDIMKTYKITLN
jgi:16S rRNA U516 pseudouridylate synthase RsuA-like enzyme